MMKQKSLPKEIPRDSLKRHPALGLETASLSAFFICLIATAALHADTQAGSLCARIDAEAGFAPAGTFAAELGDCIERLAADFGG